MVSVATQSLTTRVAARSLVGFVLALAAICAVLAPKASSQESGSSPDANRIQVSIPIWSNPFAWPQGHGYVGWDKAIDSPNPDGYLLEAGYGDVPGLAIGLNGDMEYRPGGATWSYTAPGTTRIASAQMNLSYRNKMFAHHCLGVGLRNNEGNRHLVENCNPPEPDSQASYDVLLEDPSSEPTSKEAFFNVRMPICNNPDDTPCSKWIPSLDLIKNGPLARLHSVDMVLVDDDLPVVTPSGPFYDLNGTYIDGRQSYGLTVDATDAGAGIERMDIDHLNNPQLANKDAACDPAHHTLALDSRICPPEDQIDTVVDTNPMPEGTRRFDANAKDLAENVGHAPWTVIIDRTPPSAPGATTFATPEDGIAQVSWGDSRDPELADGTPGSGVTKYLSRYRANGGEFTSWAAHGVEERSSSRSETFVPGTWLEYEVTAVDSVGNISAPSVIRGQVIAIVPSIVDDGDLVALDDSSIDGSEGNVGVDLHSTDTGVGVKRVWITDGDGNVVASTSQACIWRSIGIPSCPNAVDTHFDIEVAPWAEGMHTLTVHAMDGFDAVATLDPITIFVDRSPPVTPSTVAAVYFGTFDTTSVTWDTTLDALLPDNMGYSGVGDFLVSTSRDGLAWSGWTEVEMPRIHVPGRYSTIYVRLQAIDVAGNRSGISEYVVPVVDAEEAAEAAESETGTLSAFAFLDENRNGFRDLLERPADNVAISAAGVSLVTGVDGFASAEAEAGNYSVRITNYEPAAVTFFTPEVDLDAGSTASIQVGVIYSQSSDNELINKWSPAFWLNDDDGFQPAGIDILRHMNGPEGRKTKIRWKNGRKSQSVDFTISNLVNASSRRKQTINNPRGGSRSAQLPLQNDARQKAGGQVVVYSYVRHSGGSVQVVYWLFYTFNFMDFDLGYANHEGDWERVLVSLDSISDGAPNRVYLSRHGENHPIRGSRMSMLDNHPIVHIAKGSHAHYRSCGKKERNNLPDDHAACSDGDRQLYVSFNEDHINREQYEIRTMKTGNNFDSWSCWNGKWGPNGDSPRSPASQDNVC